MKHEIVIVHSGDLHLGAGGKKPEKREERFIVFSKLLDLCRNAGADALLLAGDLLEQDALEEAELLRVKTLLGELAAAQCPVFITPGNHDPADPLSSYRREDFWPEGVKIFGEPETLCFPEKGFSVSGAGFRQIYQREELLPKIAAAYREAEAQGETRDCPLALAVLHGEIKQGAGGLYNPIDPREAAASPFAYLALGHVHTPDLELRRAGNCLYASCGTPQGTSKKDKGERGARLLHFAGAELRETHFVPLAYRVYRERKLRLDGPENAAEALRQIRAQLDAAQAKLPDAETCWDLTLAGESAGSYVPDAKTLKQHLKSEGYLISRLADETRVRLEPQKLAKENSLRGLFFRDMQNQIAAREGEEKALYEEALRLGMDAFRGNLTEQGGSR